MSILLAKCAAGAKLEPFVYTFLDNDGAAVDLTGYTGTVTWLRHSDDTSGEFAATATGGSAGTVTFTLPDALTATEDVVDVQAWAGNSSIRLDGQRWRVVVAEAAGTAPSI